MMRARLAAALAAVPLALALGAGTAQAAGPGPAVPLGTPAGASPAITYYYFEHADTSGGRSGYCIDDPNNTTTNGTRLQLWTCHDVHQEWWVAVQVPGYPAGYYYLELYNGKCADLAGDSTANGTPIQIWTCNGRTSQIWEYAANPGNTYNIWVNVNGQAFDDIGDRNSSGNLQQGYTNLVDNSQAWWGPGAG